jgi:vitamin B12 transporter
MRFSGFLLVCLFAASVAAAQIRIQVIDPQSAALARAEVQLFPEKSTKPVAVGVTSSDGTIAFSVSDSAAYKIQVLAPGFAAQTVNIPPRSSRLISIQLKLAPASETVVVSATRTPVEDENSGANVDTLNGGQLQTMNPVAANDALRFLPGAIINTAGQHGGLASLFVRGGDSTYNKVIVDGVTINVPGGRFDFGTLPLGGFDYLEFLRGAQSTLYGSDAMTSVVQVWTQTGSTRTPELRFGADGGNFGTAHGYASLSGARGRFDYFFFGDQFNSNGQGINEGYSDALQGGNVGIALSDQVSLRVRVRNSNSHSGVPGEWNFNGDPILPPDPHEAAQLNNLLGSVELSVNSPAGWQHHFTGFDYHYQYTDLNLSGDPARVEGNGFQFDFPSHQSDDINRVGFEYQGSYLERSRAQTTFGYRIENENGFIGDLDYPPLTHGQRLNNEVYGQQQLSWKRLSIIAGARYIHNSAFGNAGVPRVALMWQALHGGDIFSGTILRFTYATGFKEPALDETFASLPYYIANPALQPERNRSFEAGFQQNLLANRYVLTGTYFNNLFTNQIEFATDPNNYLGQFFNVNKSLAHGAEVTVQSKLASRLVLNTAYTYTSSEILQAPLCTPANFCDPLYDAGNPLLRRPKHSATALLTYLGQKWGANLGGSFSTTTSITPPDKFAWMSADGTPSLHALPLTPTWRTCSTSIIRKSSAIPRWARPSGRGCGSGLAENKRVKKNPAQEKLERDALPDEDLRRKSKKLQRKPMAGGAPCPSNPRCWLSNSDIFVCWSAVKIW